MRTDGYAPIRDYALIGDGRTTALVARDGAIDWLCLPNIDSPSVFAAILDAERGGTFVVQPAIPFESRQQYVADTNVLETTFVTDRGTVRVTDALTIPDGALCPMRELARSIEGLAGRVPMRWRFAPRFDYGRARPEPSSRHGVPVATWKTEALAVRSWDAGTPAWHEDEVRAEFEIAEGGRALIALASAYSEPLVLPARSDVETRLQHTIGFWRTWTGAREYVGPWQDMVRRSALALKLLIFAPSGATAAAPTTSLPESIGGERNWDYRFCWIRDSAFLIESLLQLGCRDEARALFWWFMQATALTEPELQVLYRLDGGPHAPEFELPLAGYRGSRPVRIGNKAVDQAQLDVYGDLLQTAWLYGRGGHALSGDTGAVLARIADHVCDIWRRPDSGIWEVRSHPRQFTHSKVMCWVALDRACKLAKTGELPAGHRPRWERERAAIEQFVETDCWSEQQGSYTRSAGSHELDAALLMIPLVGYGDATGPRVRGTIDAVIRDLRDGPFVYRYKGEDGVSGSEGCFLNCSFWLAGALARTGRVEEATALMEELVGHANGVGLYSEEIDPRSGEFLGNFPQALVHLALIDAAIAIADATSETAHEPGRRRAGDGVAQGASAPHGAL
jgi:GH15 family glucan-1,4-alpha-glucosidase